MKEKTKKILERIGDNIPFIFLIIMTLLVICVILKEIELNNEMVNVDGVIVDKDETRLYIFVLMEDDGNVIKFSVDVDDWYAYEIGDRYSNEIRKGDFISKWWEY